MSDLRGKIFADAGIKKHTVEIDGLKFHVSEPTIGQANENSKLYFKQVGDKLEIDNFESAFHYLVNLVTDPNTGECIFTPEDRDTVYNSSDKNTVLSKLVAHVVRIARGLEVSQDDIKRK